MTAPAQDTNWGALFPAPLNSADRCIGTSCALSDPNGRRYGGSLFNILTLVQQITSLFGDITLDSPIGQHGSTLCWKSGAVRCAAAPASNKYTMNFKPEKNQPVLRLTPGNIKRRARRS